MHSVDNFKVMLTCIVLLWVECVWTLYSEHFRSITVLRNSGVSFQFLHVALLYWSSTTSGSFSLLYIICCNLHVIGTWPWSWQLSDLAKIWYWDLLCNVVCVCLCVVCRLGTQIQPQADVSARFLSLSQCCLLRYFYACCTTVLSAVGKHWCLAFCDSLFLFVWLLNFPLSAAVSACML